MTIKPISCPFCGAGIKENIGGFIEIGEFISSRYEVEGYVDSYVCVLISCHVFYVWPDCKPVNKEYLNNGRVEL